MRIFYGGGPQYTQETVEIAVNQAASLKCAIVLASSSGQTAITTLDYAKRNGFCEQIVVVTLAYGYSFPNKNAMGEQSRQKLERQGIDIVTAGHALSGAERGISKKYHSILPVELIASTLKMLSSGVKVCVEIGTMALDAGKICYGMPVVCIGGSGSGADTACIITPEYSANILETKIHEILCMPY